MSKIHSDLKAYFEYKGVVKYPTLVLNSNSFATYTHSRETIQINPSVSISISSGLPNASVSIGIGVGEKFDVRTTYILINYNPN